MLKGLGNHSIKDPTLLNRKENANDCTTSTWQGPKKNREPFFAVNKFDSGKDNHSRATKNMTTRLTLKQAGGSTKSRGGNLPTAPSSSSHWDRTHWKTSNWDSEHSSRPDDLCIFLKVRTSFGCLEKNLQPTDGVCDSSSILKHKTKYACIVDADESVRIRLESVPQRYHEDHFTAKGMNSLSRYNLVHKFIPMPQALKVPDAQAAVGNSHERRWFGRTNIFPWSCIPGVCSTTMWDKQRYCRQLQSHVWITNFHGRIWKASVLWEFSYFFVVLRYGRSCQEMCGTILWVGTQDDSTTLQSIYSLHRWPSFQRRRIEILLENCHKYALKLFWNAYTWHVFEDLTFCDQ